MSRMRFVGGDIIETTGGNHKVYCKENIEMSSDSQMSHVGKSGGIIYGEPKKAPVIITLKKILDIKWMCAGMDNIIDKASVGEKVSLLVKTVNYKEGETVTIIVDEVDGKDLKIDIKEITYSGKVNAEGMAELKEEVIIEIS